MPRVMENPFRGAGLGDGALTPCDDGAGIARLLRECPAHAPTPLHGARRLAKDAGVAALWIKDERGRMNLGSFKALGAAYAIARHAEAEVGKRKCHWNAALAGRTYVTASAGNHGLSVAAGAQIFGARAVIYLSDTVPEAFADRLREKGADVVRDGADYEASMSAAADAAKLNDWTLLSDSSWPGYTDMPYRVMEGYLQLAAESVDQMTDTPTDILLQAGVGGLAAAVAAYARRTWRDAPRIIVVEPEAAPALWDSIAAGRVVDSTGPVSSMGRLDCKTPSMIALNGLARDADAFVLISEDEAQAALPVLARHGFETTPSGGAGLAALLAGLDLEPDAHVWAILSEGPEGG